MLTCKGYTLSKHFAYVELLCTLHKSPDLQQSVNTSHFLQIPPAADSLLSTFRAFLPHPMPARRQPRCFARLNTWGRKPKEGKEEKKKSGEEAAEAVPWRLPHGGGCPPLPLSPPIPLTCRTALSCSLGTPTIRQTSSRPEGSASSMARQHEAARSDRTRRSAAFPQRRPSPPLRRPRGGAAPSGGHRALLAPQGVPLPDWTPFTSL